MTVASPEATGQAGASFEQHVDAAFLAMLLVRGTPPFMLRNELVEVHLQAGHFGWATDDLLLVGLDGEGQRHRTAISVKRAFAVAKSDVECIDVFGKAWRDFTSSQFNPSQDAIGLVLRSGSERVLRPLRALIDTARASGNGADFAARLALPAYRDKTVRAHAATIREVVAEARGQAPSDDELRSFLCCFDFVCLDLNTPSSAFQAMLVSLLRASAVPGQPTTVGIETWQELLAIVSSGSPDAKSFSWETLPSAMRSHYAVTTGYVARLLEPFAQMTRIVRDGTVTEIAGHHEPRMEIVQHALELLQTTQLVFISGMSGSGKSAVAKSVIDALARSRFAIAMRAEALARTSINEALISMGTSLTSLQEATALHSSKILWIDAAERLLEKSEREAFNDLMTIVKKDPSWRVIVTCRSYTLDTFTAAFVDHHGIGNETLQVPLLRRDELDAIACACPALQRPLSSEPLRRLLANPFFLKMASRMEWPTDVLLPRTEREFRLSVWMHTVRRDEDTSDGMPLRREATYVQVARKRAESLDAFVDVEGLDAGAILKLKADTLLFENEDALGRFAPAHDVLEDWALLQWLDREHERARRAWPLFLSVVGTSPALRRAFRAWLSERLERDSSALASVAELLADTSIDRHWADDALVSVLRSTDPAIFLKTNDRALLSHGARLLHRTVHLARVACQESVTVETLRGAVIAQRPRGVAWQRLAEFIAVHVEVVVPTCRSLLLRFVEEWCTVVDRDTAYPPGSDAIAAIARRLLADVDTHRYSPDPSVRSLLCVILRLPNFSAELIRGLAAGCLGEEDLRLDQPFVDLVLSHFHGAPVARDLPDVTFGIARRMLRPALRHAHDQHSYGARETITAALGLDDCLDHYGHPASAYHGPFLNLLYAHPRDGVEFIVDTLNRCSNEYLAPHSDWLTFEFELPSGKQTRHRGDGRLWSMFRVNSGPNAICSMLMALEHWLLEIGASNPQALRVLATHIMERAETIALTAVVVSVTTAYPDALGELAIEFLRHRDLIFLDRSRWTSDRTMSDKAFAEAFPAFTAENEVFHSERVESSELPHRRVHLEMLAVRLQAGILRERVQAVLDEAFAALPTEGDRTDDDRWWCLALHRMDSRRLKHQTDHEGNQWLTVAAPPADVQALIDREQPISAAIDIGLGVYNWAHGRYERTDHSACPASVWRPRLEHVRDETPVEYADARVVVAIVCLRDHLEDLEPAELAWCIETACSSFNKPESPNGLGMGVGNDNRRAARELGGVVARLTDPRQRSVVEHALCHALTVEDHDVSQCASVGIGRGLPDRDPTLLKCFATMLNEYTCAEYASAASFRRMTISDERHDRATLAREALRTDATKTVTSRRVELEPILANIYFKSPARFIVRELAHMFAHSPTDSDARTFFELLATQLRETWAASRSVRRSRDGERQGFDYETEVFVTQAICTFALGLSEAGALELFAPFRDEAQRNPAGGARLLHHLTRMECNFHRPAVFWAGWSVLSEGLIHWINSATSADRRTMQEVTAAIFLGLEWLPATLAWSSMTGHDQLVVDAFARLQGCDEVIEQFAAHLTTIGRDLLPDVMPVLAKKLTEPCVRLTDTAIIRLEKALSNVIHSGAPRVRQDPQLRDATLVVLGRMIESGSSRAYRMRDDFITATRARGN